MNRWKSKKKTCLYDLDAVLFLLVNVVNVFCLLWHILPRWILRTTYLFVPSVSSTVQLILSRISQPALARFISTFTLRISQVDHAAMKFGSSSNTRIRRMLHYYDYISKQNMLCVCFNYNNLGASINARAREGLREDGLGWEVTKLWQLSCSCLLGHSSAIQLRPDRWGDLMLRTRVLTDIEVEEKASWHVFTKANGK